MNNGFDTILLDHIRRYPAMQLVDIYKLVYQASLGSQHAIEDPAKAQRWLDEELASLGPGPAESLLDPIAPDGSILRVHLRPFLKQGGNTDFLLKAFVSTSNEYRNPVTMFESYWEKFLHLVDEGKMPFSSAEARAFWHAMSALNYPVSHHSPAFKSAYFPAYRVVASHFWQCT